MAVVMGAKEEKKSDTQESLTRRRLIISKPKTNIKGEKEKTVQKSGAPLTASWLSQRKTTRRNRGGM